MQMQLHALNGIQETIAALKVEAAEYRTQAQAVSDTVPLLRQAHSQTEYYLRQVLQDGESSSSQIRGQRSAVSRAGLAVDKAISEAMLLEQRAATIEGSIISLTLQAQVQAAASAPVAPAPVAAPTPAPVPIAAPAPVVPKSVIVTAPVSTLPPVPITEPEPAPNGAPLTKAGAGSFIPDVQVPEAPLPITLPPISRMQPAAAAPGVTISEPAPATDLQKLLPWALAAGAAFLFMNKSKRKRRYA